MPDSMSMVLRPMFRMMSPGGPRGRLSILIFHRVLDQVDPLFPGEPDVRRFDQILGWVGQWFRVMPLDRAVAQLREGRLPNRAAAITFDDGYADNATNALPLLQHHGMAATFFVATGFVDGGRMWNDTLIEAVRNSSREDCDLAALGLGRFSMRSHADRRNLIDQALGKIKYLPPAARFEALEQVQQAVTSWAKQTPMMTRAQVRALRDGGMQVGAHTRSHPILDSIPDDDAAFEIRSSKTDLESILGEAVTLFAYPNGKPGGDYAGRHVAMVRDAGYDAAVSTVPGACERSSDRFQLPRFTPWDRQRGRYAARMLNNLRTRAVAHEATV